MIKLEAFTPVDGWAVARDEQGPWLLRPPYRLRDRILLSEKATITAVVQENFTPADEDFLDWTTLIRTLQDRRVQAAGPDVDAQVRQAAGNTLARGNAEDLARHLDTIETLLIPAGYRKEAAEALKALLKATAPVLGDHPELLRRLAGLLCCCADQPSPCIHQDDQVENG